MDDTGGRPMAYPTHYPVYTRLLHANSDCALTLCIDLLASLLNLH
jgi:hypothetical protein